MALARVVAIALAVAAASPAAAQLRNRSISVEAGVSAPIAAAAGERAALAVSAAAWLDGPVEAVARLGSAAAPRPSGRGAARVVSGTAGLRVSLLPDPFRPQLGLELGWARVTGAGADAGAEDRLAWAVSGGLEWFPARDLSLTARGALRGAGTGLAVEIALAAAAYF